MTEPPHPYRGNVITYLDTDDPEEEVFRRAVVVGIGVADPETEVTWVPVVRPDCELTLVDPALIVPSMTSEPDPNASQDSSVGPAHVLAGALSTLACGMTEVDHAAPEALSVVRNLLTRFVDTIAPVDAALVVAQPCGGLAMVLSRVGSAAAEFELGRVGLGRAAILRANSVMTGLMTSEPKEQ